LDDRDQSSGDTKLSYARTHIFTDSSRRYGRQSGPASTTSPARKSPELSIMEPGGKSTPLSSFKGKVIVIEFLFLGSQHCMRVATTLNKLYEELGSRGLQPVGIAFGPDATAANTYLATKNLKTQLPCWVRGHKRRGYLLSRWQR